MSTEEKNHEMLSDIFDIPSVIRTIYQNYVEKKNPELTIAASLLGKRNPIIFSGMVTSEYSAYPASIVLSQGGILNCVVEAAELLHYHRPILNDPSCLVAVSQSGESGEIVQLLEKAHGNVPVVGVYNDDKSFLAKNSNVGLPIFAGQPHACGTKTNVASIAVLLLLAEAVISKNIKFSGKLLLNIAEHIDSLLAGWESLLMPACEFLADAQDIIFIGRGPGLCSAKFSSVLFRETVKCVSEGFSAATFRHGPLEMVKPEHRVVIFAPMGCTYDLCIKLAMRLMDFSVPVMVVTDRDSPLHNEKGLLVMKTGFGLDLYSPVVDIVPFQLIGFQLAKWKGFTPGKLEKAEYITRNE